MKNAAINENKNTISSKPGVSCSAGGSLGGSGGGLSSQYPVGISSYRYHPLGHSSS